jgi:hypothetical protein
MANELEGKRVAFLFTDGVEQVELTEPAGSDPERGCEGGSGLARAR